ncbi:MAG: Tat pathway signal protein, partial [Lachnospiraceae bacterium]|nr:Tat pathway signal protein [Lachnospiraceae bacterium]
KFSLPTTPFVLCFLIGEMLETYLRRGIMQYKSFTAFFARPIFDAFFFVAIGVLVWSLFKEYKAYRAKKAS